MLSVRLIKKLEGIEKCTKEVESRVRLTPPARFGRGPTEKDPRHGHLAGGLPHRHAAHRRLDA